MDDLQFKIALNCIPQIGPLLTRRLIAYVGSVEGVFKEKKQHLEKIPGIGTVKARGFNPCQLLKEAEEELKYVNKHSISVLFYLDDIFPNRLGECEDGPIILYVKGVANFNAAKVISMVGTRKATPGGKALTEEIVAFLAANHPEMLFVSGLAYGIDITAHKAALDAQVETVAVMGHGFEYLYPASHRQLAEKIAGRGALVTEFQSRRKPEAGNFVSRNRIIAGLADATLIIESAEKGGALITADLANSYNRDVFAVPGRPGDYYSKGCNELIKTNRAALAESGADIEKAMRWSIPKKNQAVQQKLALTDLKAEEKLVLDYLGEKGETALDQLSYELDIPVHVLSGILLQMEFKSWISSLPGKCYRRN
ncbi:MAG: DNA-processing protein DprA [Bacteroidales bacterium]|nr:DNA-processing protein DprA [Bacteroidales bacterium]